MNNAPLQRVADHFKGTWRCEVVVNGKTIMIADEKHTEFGTEELDEFFASRFTFLASQSLDPPWTPVSIVENQPVSTASGLPKMD